MSKDILNDFFERMPDEQPSAHFRDKLMQMVEQKSIKAKRRQAQWEMFSVIVTSIALIAMALLTYMYSVDDYNINSILSIFQFDYQVNLVDLQLPMLIAGSALLLLYGDFHMRRYFKRKEQSKL